MPCNTWVIRYLLTQVLHFFWKKKNKQYFIILLMLMLFLTSGVGTDPNFWRIIKSESGSRLKNVLRAGLYNFLMMTKPKKRFSLLFLFHWLLYYSYKIPYTDLRSGLYTLNNPDLMYSTISNLNIFWTLQNSYWVIQVKYFCFK